MKKFRTCILLAGLVLSACVNIVPQASDLNRGPWSKLEAYCRDQARDGDRDLYVVAGPAASRSSL